ncbi:MAG: hypothetical protein KDD25_05605, partial [Bdellovibrionales bacterium]|nr:hypothetical protein [Bdellovibrionales bacterium]
MGQYIFTLLIAINFNSSMGWSAEFQYVQNPNVNADTFIIPEKKVKTQKFSDLSEDQKQILYDSRKVVALTLVETKTFLGFA